MRKLLVNFGTYLLSLERSERTSQTNQDVVTHADIENFLDEHPEYKNLRGIENLLTSEPMKLMSVEPKKFEYCYDSHHIGENKIDLNSYGKQGWELLSVFPLDYIIYYHFKREIPSTPL